MTNNVMTKGSSDDYELEYEANCLIVEEKVKKNQARYKKVIAKARKMLAEMKKEKSDRMSDLENLVKKPKKIG